MRYNVTSNFTQISETSGTIQNISNIYTVEVSDRAETGSGILLYPLDKFSFNDTTLFMRCLDVVGKAEIIVVPFDATEKGGGGGGNRPDFAVGQTGTNLVDNFRFSALAYPNAINPNLDGKTVLVLAVKDVNGESDAVKYVFVDLAKVIDVYSAGDSSILVTDGDISVRLSKMPNNALSIAADGLFASLAVSGGVSGNIAIFDESGRVVDGGLGFADLRYELPTASSSTKGGVKVGSGLSISGDTLSAPVMTAASSTAGGASGLVPAPSAGDNEKFLRGDGSWVVPTDTNTTYSAATATTSGLMSASDKSKLNGIESGAEVNAIEEIWVDGVAQTITNKKATLDLDDYAKKSDVASVWKRKGSVNSFSDLPANAEEGDVYNIKTAGGTDGEGIAVKAGDNVVRTSDGKWDVLAGTVDLSGYVEKVSGKQLSTNDFTDAQKNKLNNLASITTAGSNITISGGTIKSANTTYSDASTTASGLMSASDKIKLNGIATSANNYTLPTASSSTKGGVKIGTGLSMSTDTLNATVMTAATSSASGKAGLVPAPAAGKQTSFLRGDGTWVIPTDTNTTYSVATTTTSGLMSAADKATLNALNPLVSTVSKNVEFFKTTGTPTADIVIAAPFSETLVSGIDLSTLVDGTNFEFDGTTRIRSGSSSYNVNGGISRGYVKIPSSTVGRTLQVAAAVSSESSYDYGGCILSTGAPNTTFTLANLKASTFFAIAGSVSSKIYTAWLEPNVDHYLNFGYAKDSNQNKNDDRFYIYGITISQSICIDSNPNFTGTAVFTNVPKIASASTTASGLMSSTDKKKLDSLASITTAGSNITISNGTISGTANTTYTAGSNITISDGTISAAVVLNTVSSTVDGAMWIEV